jgi:hypothetical protein
VYCDVIGPPHLVTVARSAFFVGNIGLRRLETSSSEKIANLLWKILVCMFETKIETRVRLVSVLLNIQLRNGQN